MASPPNQVHRSLHRQGENPFSLPSSGEHELVALELTVYGELPSEPDAGRDCRLEQIVAEEVKTLPLPVERHNLGSSKDSRLPGNLHRMNGFSRLEEPPLARRLKEWQAPRHLVLQKEMQRLDRIQGRKDPPSGIQEPKEEVSLLAARGPALSCVRTNRTGGSGRRLPGVIGKEPLPVRQQAVVTSQLQALHSLPRWLAERTGLDHHDR